MAAPTPGWGAFHVPKRPAPKIPGPKRGIPKLPRPKPPTGLPGRPKPIPVKPPGTVTPTPTVPRPDFGAWYHTDPRYLLQHPQFAAQRAGLYAQYGWQPQTDAAGNTTGYAQSSAADNPYSIVNQLAEALAGKSQNVADTANSRGLLFSGAQVQGQQNATHGYEGQLSDAMRAFQAALSGVNTNESQMVSDLYPDYLAQAPPAGPATPATTAAAKPATTTSAAAAEAARKARVKKAQDHLRQDKINAAKKKKPPSGKKTITGGIAGGA